MTEEKPIETEPVNSGSTALDIRDASDTAVELVRKRVDNQNKLMKIAISLTGPKQWARFGDSIYPCGGASDTILRRVFGLTWSTKKISVDESGQHATATATLMLNGQPIEEFTGYRSMGGFVKNRADLIKGAIENMKSVAVRDLLGLRFRTPAELKAIGLDVDKIETQVDFQEHEKDPSTITVPFGKEKGKPITEVSDGSLQWLAEAVKKSVADPDKSKWKDKNQALLDALRAEYKRRHQKKEETKDEPPHDPDTGEVKEDYDYGPDAMTDEELAEMES